MSKLMDIIYSGTLLDLRDFLVAKGTPKGDAPLNSSRVFKSAADAVFIDAGGDATKDSFYPDGPRYLELNRTVDQVDAAAAGQVAVIEALAGLSPGPEVWRTAWREAMAEGAREGQRAALEAWWAPRPEGEAGRRGGEASRAAAGAGDTG